MDSKFLIMFPKRWIILLCISGSIDSCPTSNSEATLAVLSGKC
jgi:hypothetical protein